MADTKPEASEDAVEKFRAWARSDEGRKEIAATMSDADQRAEDIQRQALVTEDFLHFRISF